MATDKVDMSLDDIIRQERGSQRGGRGRGGRRGGGGFRGNRGRGGFGGGGGRRFGSSGTGGGGVSGGGVQKPRGGARRPVYTRGDIDGKWQHDLFRSSELVTPVTSARDNSRLGKLLISNLDFGVSDSDITELFTEFGPLIRAAVHYDRSGRSLGTAEVLFEMKTDATKAQQQYDNVPLDGRPMKIQLVGGESTSQTNPRPLMDRIDRGERQNFGQRGRGRSRGRGGSGGGRGGRDRNSGKSNLTKEQLDAQLDEYKMDVN